MFAESFAESLLKIFAAMLLANIFNFNFCTLAL